MKITIEQKAVASVAVIVAAFAICGWLVYTGSLSAWSLLAPAALGWYLRRLVYNGVNHYLNDTPRRLRKYLPKCGFSIEHEEWSEDHTAVRFYGKFRKGESMMLEATKGNGFFDIVDLPWSQLKEDDPGVGRFLEAINEWNSLSAINICLMEPDDEGYRNIYTKARLQMPPYMVQNFLESMIIFTHNTKYDFRPVYEKERPWLHKQKRSTIGFAADAPEPLAATHNAAETPAASTADTPN